MTFVGLESSSIKLLQNLRCPGSKFSSHQHPHSTNRHQSLQTEEKTEKLAFPVPHQTIQNKHTALGESPRTSTISISLSLFNGRRKIDISAERRRAAIKAMISRLSSSFFTLSFSRIYIELSDFPRT